MNPYPQYLKALEMKTDGKGHFQAEKTSIPREGDNDNLNPRRCKRRPGEPRCLLVIKSLHYE
jgi:hypothetical protein